MPPRGKVALRDSPTSGVDDNRTQNADLVLRQDLVEVGQVLIDAAVAPQHAVQGQLGQRHRGQAQLPGRLRELASLGHMTDRVAEAALAEVAERQPWQREQHRQAACSRP